MSPLEAVLSDELLALGVSLIGGVIWTASFILGGRVFLVSGTISVGAHSGNCGNSLMNIL